MNMRRGRLNRGGGHLREDKVNLIWTQYNGGHNQKTMAETGERGSIKKRWGTENVKTRDSVTMLIQKSKEKGRAGRRGGKLDLDKRLKILQAGGLIGLSWQITQSPG